MGFLKGIKNIFNKQQKSSKKHNSPMVKNSSEIHEHIDSVLNKKLAAGVLPGEIILLNWINGRISYDKAPKYFEYGYNINTENSIEKLINKELILYSDNISVLNTYKVSQLKELLKDKNLPINGIKSDLITRLSNHLTKEEINKLPKSYTLTEEGNDLLEEYDYIVEAHRDRYFDVADAILYKKKVPADSNYADMKWSFLNEKSNKYYLNKQFGLFRNIQLARYQQLKKENKFQNALSYCIFVVLLDCSGLGNDFKYYGKPFYENIIVAPGILKDLKKLNNELSDAEYDSAFKQAESFLSKQNLHGFLTDTDIHFLHGELSKPSASNIENHFKKYKKYSIDKELNKLR